MLVVLALAGCGGEESSAPKSEKTEAPKEPVEIVASDGRSWRVLKADGLHDPANPMLPYLQQPARALGDLPKGKPEGNQVDWMEALRIGAVQPRASIQPGTRIRVLDLDIRFTETAGMPNVVFPHRQHTEWLDCANCHDGIFIPRKGANDIGMFDILQGEFCGRCHGAVAFPLTECLRCHNEDRPVWKANR